MKCDQQYQGHGEAVAAVAAPLADGVGQGEKRQDQDKGDQGKPDVVLGFKRLLSARLQVRLLKFAVQFR